MRMSLEPPRAPRLQLAPGAARVALSLDLSTTFPTLALGDVPLDDPLDGPEDQVASLEDSGASPAARARAWKIVAEVARERLGALDEHARAAREAAAADPEDTDHLRRAAEACTAIEETELALAYGKSGGRDREDGGSHAPARWSTTRRSAAGSGKKGRMRSRPHAPRRRSRPTTRAAWS
ncbi:MAG: hypothetical protein IPN34_27705 [Planctomycetes bacterium]|nr:hypothetical protein [Planctomycetota bacterium]